MIDLDVHLRSLRGISILLAMNKQATVSDNLLEITHIELGGMGCCKCHGSEGERLGSQDPAREISRSGSTWSCLSL